MRPSPVHSTVTQLPALLDSTTVLQSRLASLTTKQISQLMHLSPALAQKTTDTIKRWSPGPQGLQAAIDAFVGDIYSGLQVQTWNEDDRNYANDHLRILSGLYGILRPLDGVHPYRLEMGYRLRVGSHDNLYRFWGERLADALPKTEPIINLTSVEYGKAIIPYCLSRTVITPRFLTLNPKTKRPSFVAVHAKIARGAYAGWMVKNRVEQLSELKTFTEIGYHYDAKLSTKTEPAYVCQAFGGLGLSVRLSSVQPGRASSAAAEQ